MQNHKAALTWLLENAGPIIRYRVKAELREEPENKIEPLKENMLSSKLVQFWLENLKPNFDRNVLHSGKTEAYENAMGKLYEFGVRKGFQAFDERTEPFRRWLKKEVARPNDWVFSAFHRTIVAAFLSMTGYWNDDSVDAWITRRLDTLYAFAKEGNLNVYLPQDTFPSFPKCYRNYPLIDPALYPDGELRLPWIHDINAFLHSASIMEDAQPRRKVETIIDLILRSEYQKLHIGYGVLRHKPGKYYVMGWSVHLPGYFAEVQGEDFGRLLLLLSLMSRSNKAKNHPWFKRSMAMLERYVTAEGLTCFPRAYLPEKRFGYWVWGARMGLEENRKVQKAMVCESTFRTQEIMSRVT